MEKVILLMTGLSFTAMAQTIKPLPKDQHITPPSIRESYKAPKQIPNLRYLKPQDLQADTARIAYAEQDNMPILKVKGLMPNLYSNNPAYRMPRYLYDDKKRQEVK